jgi:DNA-3-methyladenine glycosylase II
MQPSGPFDLLFQNQYFNGWPRLTADDQTIVMCFPVEGWLDSAAVSLSQHADGSLDIRVFGTMDTARARQQALSAMSLDEDGTGWPDIAQSDDFITGLKEKYRDMRPTLFHSPYEAAAAFIIGHRISIPQTRKIRVAMAEEIGERIRVNGEDFFAFPKPQDLLKLESFKGLNTTKIERLHAVAGAALVGKLDRSYLRSLDQSSALRELETLPGVGPFFSQGILYRGAGIKDGFSHDDMTYHAIKFAYNLDDDATEEQIMAITEHWHPYRMWVIVLLHVWLRDTNNFPRRTFSKR